MTHPTTQQVNEVTFLRTQAGGPGPRLRAAREALGLGLADIGKRMRLKEHVIHQIEQDIYDEGTAIVFIKGYLRSYAVLVGLNPDQIIQDFTSMGVTEDRDVPDLSKLIKKSERPRRRMNLPLTLQSNPGIVWGCVSATVLAIIGLLWAYSGSISTLGSKTKVLANTQPVVLEASAATPAAGQMGPAATQAQTATDPKLATQAKNPAAAGSTPAPQKAAAPAADPMLF